MASHLSCCLSDLLSACLRLVLTSAGMQMHMHTGDHVVCTYADVRLAHSHLSNNCFSKRQVSAADYAQS